MDFDQAAAKWDSENRCKRAKILAGKIRNSWGNNTDKVLDFGCGTGLLTYELYPFANQIYGYDTSEEMQKIFQLKKDQYKADNVSLIAMEEIEKRKFDIILTSMVLHHVEDVSALVIRLKDALSDSGRFMWIDLDHEDGTFHKNEPDFNGHNGFYREEVRDILQKCGYAEIKIDTIYRGEKDTEGEPLPYSLFLAIASGGRKIENKKK